MKLHAQLQSVSLEEIVSRVDLVDLMLPILLAISVCNLIQRWSRGSQRCLQGVEAGKQTNVHNSKQILIRQWQFAEAATLTQNLPALWCEFALVAWLASLLFYPCLLEWTYIDDLQNSVGALVLPANRFDVVKRNAQKEIQSRACKLILQEYIPSADLKRTENNIGNMSV